MNKSLVPVCVILLLSPFATLLGGINPVLNYQGYLSDSLGQPYPDGIHEFTFAIYEQPTGGVSLWSEIQTLQIERGLLHAYLGSIESFDDNLFETYPLYLGITYETDPEFEPRHTLASSAYAFFSRNAGALEGYPASHFVDSTLLDDAVGQHELNPSAHHEKTIDAAELTQGTLDSQRLPTNAVGSEHLVDGGVANIDLAPASVSGDKIAVGSIGNQHLLGTAVTGDKIVDNTVTGDDVADSTINGQNIAAGAINNNHLSISAITGDNVADGSLTGADLEDSTITGVKIARESITSQHLAAASWTGDDIVDGSLTGADLMDGSITYFDIALGAVRSENILDGSITNNDIATNSISGSRILNGTIGNVDLGWNSVGNNQIITNAVNSVHVLDNSLLASDLQDEPGLDHSSASFLTSVGQTVTNWLTVTISAPSAGYILALFNTSSQMVAGESANAGISTSPTTMGYYGEARITSTAYGTGATIPISVTTVITVAAAGDIAIYGNVRAGTSSSGEVDFMEGRLQAVFISTAY